MRSSQSIARDDVRLKQATATIDDRKIMSDILSLVRCPCRELSSHLCFTTTARQSISSPRELDDDAQPSAVPMM